MQKLINLKMNALEAAFNHDPEAPIGDISWSKYDYPTTVTMILCTSLKKMKKTEFIEYLLKKGAQVNLILPDTHCMTSIRYAMQWRLHEANDDDFIMNYMKNLELILKSGAQFYNSPKYARDDLIWCIMNMNDWIHSQSIGNPPLYASIVKKRALACVEKLRDLGCPMTWSELVNPLTIAVEHHHSFMLDLLLKENFDPEEKFSDGTTLLDYAEALINPFRHSEHFFAEAQLCHTLLEQKINRIHHAKAVAALRTDKTNLVSTLPAEILNMVCQYIKY
jgi:hypothetical protein